MTQSSPQLPEPVIVPALLRAALAQDEQGAAVILDGLDHLALVLALCAFINQQGTGFMGGDPRLWDAALADVQRRMSGL